MWTNQRGQRAGCGYLALHNDKSINHRINSRPMMTLFAGVAANPPLSSIEYFSLAFSEAKVVHHIGHYETLPRQHVNISLTIVQDSCRLSDRLVAMLVEIDRSAIMFELASLLVLLLLLPWRSKRNVSDRRTKNHSTIGSAPLGIEPNMN